MIADHEFHGVSVWLASAARPLLLSHRRPDGDAVGALAALYAALAQRGAQPAVALLDPFPPRYELLRPIVPVWRLWADESAGLSAACDAVVILDTCSLSQLEPAMEFLARAPRTLVIDHHSTRDPIGIRDGDLRLFDESAGATCLILAEWMRHAERSAGGAGVCLTPPIAAALFTGIATDCGWFRFANTDGRTLRAAADLIDAGAAAAEIYNAIYQQERPEKLRLIARMLATLELHARGRLAVLSLRRDDFAAAGADSGMTEDLVNEAGRLGGVDATILFTEEPDGSVRVNFRSKRDLDVAALATRYGGGGHTRAAGARPYGSWETVVRHVVADAVEALEAAR